MYFGQPRIYSVVLEQLGTITLEDRYGSHCACFVVHCNLYLVASFSGHTGTRLPSLGMSLGCSDTSIASHIQCVVLEQLGTIAETVRYVLDLRACIGQLGLY